MSSNLKQQQQNQFPMNRVPYPSVYSMPKPQLQRNTYPMMMGPYPFPSNMEKLLYTKTQAPRSFLQNFTQHHGFGREELGFKGDFRAQQKKQQLQNRVEGSYSNRKKEEIIQIDDDDEKEERKAQKQVIQKNNMLTKQNNIKTKQTSYNYPRPRPELLQHKPTKPSFKPQPYPFNYNVPSHNFSHYPYMNDQRTMLLNHGLYSGHYGNKVAYPQNSMGLGRGEQFMERAYGGGGYGSVGESGGFGNGYNGRLNRQQTYFSSLYMQQNSVKDVQNTMKGNQIHYTHPPLRPQPPKPQHFHSKIHPPTFKPTLQQPPTSNKQFIKKKKPQPEVIQVIDSDQEGNVNGKHDGGGLSIQNGQQVVKERYGKVFREGFYDKLWKTKQIHKVNRGQNVGAYLKTEFNNDKQIMLERLQDLKKMKLSRQAQQNGLHTFIKLNPNTQQHPPTQQPTTPTTFTNPRTLLTLLSSDPAIMDIQQMKMLQQLYNNSNTNSEQYKSIIESFNPKALLNTTTKLLSEASPLPSSYNSALNKVTVYQSAFAENKDISGSQHVKRQAHRAFLKTRSRFMNNAGGKHPREPFTRTILSEPKPQQKRKPTSEREQQQQSTVESDAINLVSGKSSQDKSIPAFEWTPRLKKLRDVSRRRQYDNVILLGPQFQAQLPRFITDPHQIRQIIAYKKANLLKRFFKSTL